MQGESETFPWVVFGGSRLPTREPFASTLMIRADPPLPSPGLGWDGSVTHVSGTVCYLYVGRSQRLGTVCPICPVLILIRSSTVLGLF
jgi:hypothetical protein